MAEMKGTGLGLGLGSNRPIYPREGCRFGPSFGGMVRAFTLPEVNCRLELAPQFTLPDPTHFGGFILMKMRLGRGVAALSETTQRYQHEQF